MEPFKFDYNDQGTRGNTLNSSLHIDCDVVAVGAHPDDVEIGCGGTIAKMVRDGYRVAIIDITDGEPTPNSPSPDVRLDEAQQAARILGVQVRETLDLPNRLLFDSIEARIKLATCFRRLRPQLVISLEHRTPLASPDHIQAMQLTEAAVFYSRLTKWDDRFEGTSPHTIPSIASYCLDMGNLTRPAEPGIFISDISETYDKKVEAVRAYQTQFPPAKESFFTRLRSANSFWGEISGFRFGELIRSYRPIGTNRPFDLLCSHS